MVQPFIPICFRAPRQALPNATSFALPMAQSPPAFLLPRPPLQAAPSEDAADEVTTIERLISYLVAAKRSLTCIHNVHHANSVIREARITLESTAAVIAKTRYLRRSLLSQLSIVTAIHLQLQANSHAVALDFANALNDLDAADKRLQDCVDVLQRTKIEEAFKRPPDPSGNDPAAAAARAKNTLHDFVEEQPVEDLRAAMRTAIDEVQDDQRDIDRCLDSLQDDLRAIKELLAERGPALSATDSEMGQPNVIKMLHTLEDHAHEMAAGLESLVMHFDHCVAAVKHTEGAGDAVIKTIKEGNLPEDVADASISGPAQPINEAERLELLHILAEDADQVDEQAVEIQDRDASMEAQLDKILQWSRHCELAYADVAQAFGRLDAIGARLTNYVADSARHSSRWAQARAKLEDGVAGMHELCDTYNNFVNAYDRLIVEAARRRATRKQMERIIDDAHAKLDQLYNQDLTERDLFRNEQGDFLPSDIWHGLHSLPPQFAFSRADGVTDDSIPDLPRRAVDDALKRLKAGMAQAPSAR
ncbi:hypothetical protein DV735_g2340, partial [Chaetothyriales sp. CBS 134920]